MKMPPCLPIVTLFAVWLPAAVGFGCFGDKKMYPDMSCLKASPVLTLDIADPDACQQECQNQPTECFTFAIDRALQKCLTFTTFAGYEACGYGPKPGFDFYHCYEDGGCSIDELTYPPDALIDGAGCFPGGVMGRYETCIFTNPNDTTFNVEVICEENAMGVYEWDMKVISFATPAPGSTRAPPTPPPTNSPPGTTPAPGTPATPAPGTPPGTPATPAPGTPPGTPATPAPGTPPGTPATPAPGTPPGTPATPAPGTPPGTPVTPAPGTPPGTTPSPGGKPGGVPTPTATLTLPGPQPPTDECAVAENHLTCAKEGQLCKDPNQQIAGDWTCNCVGDRGSAVAKKASCDYTGTTCAFYSQTCTQEGQACVPNGGNWQCECIPPAKGVPQIGLYTTCVLDECIESCPTCRKALCPAMTVCVDNDTSPLSLQDWSCVNATAAPPRGQQTNCSAVNEEGKCSSTSGCSWKNGACLAAAEGDEDDDGNMLLVAIIFCVIAVFILIMCAIVACLCRRRSNVRSEMAAAQKLEPYPEPMKPMTEMQPTPPFPDSGTTPQRTQLFTSEPLDPYPRDVGMEGQSGGRGSFTGGMISAVGSGLSSGLGWDGNSYTLEEYRMPLAAEDHETFVRGEHFEPGVDLYSPDYHLPSDDSHYPISTYTRPPVTEPLRSLDGGIVLPPPPRPVRRPRDTPLRI